MKGTTMTDTQQHNPTPDTTVSEEVDPRHDAKGRPFPVHMSERLMLEEILLNIRAVSDAVGDLAEMPLIKAMQNGENPMLAMMKTQR